VYWYILDHQSIISCAQGTFPYVVEV